MYEEVGQKRQPQDMNELTNYGKHFLPLEVHMDLW